MNHHLHRHLLIVRRECGCLIASCAPEVCDIGDVQGLFRVAWKNSTYVKHLGPKDPLPPIDCPRCRRSVNRIAQATAAVIADVKAKRQNRKAKA